MTNTKTKLTTEQRIAILDIIKLIHVGAEVEAGSSQEQIEKTARGFGVVDLADCSHSAIGERIERLDSEIGSGRSLALIQKWFEYLDRVAARCLGMFSRQQIWRELLILSWMRRAPNDCSPTTHPIYFLVLDIPEGKPLRSGLVAA